MHVRTRFQDGPAFFARPHHEGIHWTLDMLLLMLRKLVLLKMLLGWHSAASRALRRGTRRCPIICDVFRLGCWVQSSVMRPSPVHRVVCQQKTQQKFSFLSSSRVGFNVPPNTLYRVAQKRGHPISLQIFLKFHNRIAWKLVNFCIVICWTQSLTFCLKTSSRCGAT